MKKIMTSFIALSMLGTSAFAAYDPRGYGAQMDFESARAAQFRAPTLPIPAAPSAPTPSVPSVPANPTPITPTVPVVPPSYKIADCMNDVSSCVQTSLPDGIAALYNADMRNSIVNGMNLCGVAVDKCVFEALRSDGHRAYSTKNDVWIDFNSRIIQPQYYSHVLVKTGLTPYQAENTCHLLDRNVHDKSFLAVDGATDTSKQMGFEVNNPNGRGKYARWDATAGECLVRVAAYNKGELIKKEWLGLGSGEAAEEWVNAGTSFSCKKELFDYNLMNQTKSAALIGISAGAIGGAVVGGVLTGTGKNANFKLDEKYCTDKNFRAQFKKVLQDLGETANSNNINDDENVCSGIVVQYKNKRGASAEAMSQAREKVNLKQWSFVNQLANSLKSSGNNNIHNAANATITAITLDGTIIADGTENVTATATATALLDVLSGSDENTVLISNLLNIKTQITASDVEKGLEKAGGLTWWQGSLIGAGAGAAAGGLATAITAFIESNNIECRIGDSLGKVEFGKSGRVKSLKDYYVEWALRLPDTIMPMQIVTEQCGSWSTACGTIKNISDCASASVNYKPTTSLASTVVANACTASGSTCLAYNPVAISNGACP